jgi:hypothetical protein
VSKSIENNHQWLKFHVLDLINKYFNGLVRCTILASLDPYGKIKKIAVTNISKLEK